MKSDKFVLIVLLWDERYKKGNSSHKSSKHLRKRMMTFFQSHNLWPILKTFYARKLRLWGRNMGYFPVRYDSRVINYDRRGFIRLATGSLLCQVLRNGIYLK